MVGQGFSAKPLKLASITVNKQLLRLHRLYEQQHNKKSHPGRGGFSVGCLR